MGFSAKDVAELRKQTGAGMMDCKKALTECDGNMEEAKDLLRKKGQATANKKSSRETNEGAVAVASNEKRASLLKIACETDFVAINDDFQNFIQDLANQALETGVEKFSEQSSSKGKISEQLVEAISKMGENIVVLDGAAWDLADNHIAGTYTHSKGKIGVLVELQTEGSADKSAVTQVARDIAMHIAASQVEAIEESELDPAVLEKEKSIFTDQARESGKPDNIIEKMIEGRMKKFKKEICLLDQPFVKEPDKSISQLLSEQGKALGVGLKVTRFFKAAI